MEVQVEAFVRFTTEESRKIADARRALFTAGSRGPWYDNAWADSLQGWGFCTERSSGALERTRKALSCELDHWNVALGDRERTWRVHPEYRVSPMFYGTQPEDYAKVCRLLREAIEVIDEALVLARGALASAG